MTFRKGGLVAAIALAGLTQSAMAQAEPPKTPKSQTEQSGMAPGQAEPPAKGESAPSGSPPAAATHNSTTGAASTDVPMPSVVTHIPSGNDAAKFNAAADADDRKPTLAHAFALTEEQKRLISSSVTGKDSGTALEFKPEVAALAPKSITLRDMPREVTARIPYLQPYKVAVVDNQVLLVDPGNSNVVLGIVNR